MDFELVKNQFYWIEDANDSYTPCRLLQDQPNASNQYEFESFEHGNTTWINASSIRGMIPSPGELTLKSLYDDLTEAVDISEASILWNLHKRYEVQKIYSAIGPILIAINPYCFLEAVYSKELLDFFLNASVIDNRGIPPHIWGIARNSYIQLKEKNVRQAIVISGESGAGKTETTKKCLQFLSAASMGSDHPSKSNPDGHHTAIEDRVLGSNPLLESFGNSKTCRNNNSSRFGKWLEINFNCGRGKFCLIGANITQYLLEKSRVVTQADDERNYHIFYQMCSDENMGLGLPENYAYLNQSGCTAIEGVDDYEDFQETRKAFHDLHFTKEEQTMIFGALKAILYMGNIAFDEAADSSGGTVINTDTNFCLLEAAQLLGFTHADFATAITVRTIAVRGDVTVVPLPPEQAVDTRNAFAKEIYGRLFAHIVAHANKSLAFSETSSLHSENETRKKEGKRRLSMQGGQVVSIGLLDIFGFEIFTANSFEQLCINYGNEKLQQYFINYVLKKEQEIYQSEGIVVEEVHPVDNQDVLALLETPRSGMFALLDEELRLPQGSDQGFLRKVEKEHKEKSSRFKRDFRMKDDHFEIKHFAGVVLYSASNFLDKNKDKLYDHLEDLIQKSSITRFKEIMYEQSQGQVAEASGEANRKGGGGGQAKKQLDTLASRFTGQLQQLVNVLQSSEPHFVRCIKPNSIKSSFTFDSDLVLRQLRYSGVLEAIQIRKSGYPTRKTHGEFLKLYRVLSGIPIAQLNAMASDKERCACTLKQLALKSEVYGDMKLGKTMVFYRPDVHNALEQDKLEVGMKAVLYIQSAYRRRRDVARVQILWEARRALLAAMEWGKANNSSTVEAIDDIYNCLYYCEQVDLQCHVTKEGNALLERLQAVKKCLYDMEVLMEAESAPYQDKDVVSRYHDLEKAIADATELGIVHPTYDTLVAITTDLKIRVDAVLNLRAAITTFDEERLGSCLHEVTTLTEQWGAFCENERISAHNLLIRLMTEVTMAQDICEVIRDSQHKIRSYRNAIPAGHDMMESEDVRSEISASLRALQRSIAPVDDSNGYELPLCTVPAQKMLRIAEAFIEARGAMLDGEWLRIADLVIELTDQAERISDWEKDGEVHSASLALSCRSVVHLVDEEMAAVAGGIDIHVVLPMLKEGISEGVVTTLADVSDVSVDPSYLETATEHVHRIKSIGANVRCLLGVADVVLSLRQSVKTDQYEKVLALTEPCAVTACRVMRCRDIKAQAEAAGRKQHMMRQHSTGYQVEALKAKDPLTGLQTVVEVEEEEEDDTELSNLRGDGALQKPSAASFLHFPSLSDFAELDNESRLFETTILDRCQDLAPPFMFIVEKVVLREIKVARAYALDRYVQMLMASILELPRTVKDEHGAIQIVADVELSRTVNGAIEEVLALWKLESNDKGVDIEEILDKSLSPLSKRVFLVASTVCETRSLMQLESYEEVLEMHRSGKFQFAVSGRGKADTWIPSVLSAVKDELLVCVAESRNFHAKTQLLGAMKIGAVSGTIGQIITKDISYDRLTAAIRSGEECVAEDPRPSSSLKTLVAICKQLVEVRRAFQSLSPVEQTRSFRKLQTFQDQFPDEMKNEVDLLSCETDYRETTDLLERGLRLDTPVRYLVKATEAVTLRRTTLLKITPVMDTSLGGGLQDNDDDEDEDELVPNTKVLSVDLLKEGLDVARRLQERHTTFKLSDYMLGLIDISGLIVKLRCAVSDKKWESADTILKQILDAKLIDTIQIAAAEISEATEVVCNELDLYMCENALSHGQAQECDTDASLLDLSYTSIVGLEEAIHKCQMSNGHRRRRAEILYTALLNMRDLRRAVLNGDWGGARKSLSVLKQEGIGQPRLGANGKFTAMCEKEISVIHRAVTNQDAIRMLKAALLDEVVRGKPGDICIDKVEVYKLTEANGNVVGIPGSIRGEFLVWLHNLAEIILKGRKAVTQQQWNITRNLAPMWSEKLKQLKQKSEEFIEILPSLQPIAVSTATANETPASLTPKFDMNISALPTVSSAQFAYKDFDYLLSALIDELDLLQNHVTMIQLEGEVSKALVEHGVSSNEMVGQIDLSAIRTDGLELVLERKDALLKATKSTLPAHVEKLCKAAHLMLDIRRAILKNMWDSVPALLEEALTGTYHPLPEACRQEVQVIRLECENRWIISSISTALESGRLEGTFDTFKGTSDVSCDHLRGAITACQTLTPRTDEAISLLRTSEEILKLRTMLVEEYVDWQKIGEYAFKLINEGFLHETGISEVNTVISIAQNTIVCRLLEEELIKGRTTGKPGNLILSNVSTAGLAAACQYCKDSSVKSKKANELLNACRAVMSLREALARAVESPAAASEALNSVKSIVQSMYEVHSKNPKDAGWQLCKNEVALVTQDAHIREVNRQLESSVATAGRIYASRNAASIGAEPGSRRASVNAATEAVLSCDSLDAIISYVEKLDFSSQNLDNLSDCARSLRLVRDAVINADWDYVHLLGTRMDVVKPIMNIPYAVPELNWAKQEAHNRVTADKLENVLTMPHGEDDPYHEYLSNAIDEAEASDITAMATQQLLECAKNVYLLRVGLSTHDNKQVAHALRWFGVNAYRSPACVQEEAQKAYIMHQNHLLLTGVTAALQVGFATGVLGDMNISTVDTATLSKLLAQAHDVKHQTPEVREMVEVAEMIHCLRCAQRAKDDDGISKALDMLAGWGRMLPPIVVEEVAFARSERDNSAAIAVLKSIFETFDVASSASLEMSLIASPDEADGEWLAITTDSRPKIKPMPSGGNKASGRRYSIASMNRADIDLDSIDTVTLDRALEKAHEHGLYTDAAKTLYQTVLTLRNLRDAMKHNDWPRVEELLNELDGFRQEDSFYIDPLADNELSVIRNQLEMRTSIVDLSKALKTGWARCSNGIVDTDPLRVDSLVDAISRAQRCMHDLGIASDMKKLALQKSEGGKKSDLVAALASSRDTKTGRGLVAPLMPANSPGLNRFRKHFPKDKDASGDRGSSPVPEKPVATEKSKVQEQVEKLILSAVIVAEVRKALHDGRVQVAGELSEQALDQGVHSTVQDELNHYAFEIGRAMHMMKLCNQLRDGITNGNGDNLEQVIQDAKDASVAVSGDLGLVRTLERAAVVLKAINKVRKQLNAMANIYKIESIEEVLVQAKKLNISGYLIENANKRLSVLRQFETGLKDLNIGNGGMVTGRAAQQMICDLAVSLGLKNHPVARKAHVLLKLSDQSLCRALLADAMASGNLYAAATETIRIKRQFLRLPESIEEYSIEKFPRLRSPSEFSMRLALESSELKHSMLRHTDGLIGTSITKLSPVLAALAVVVFTHTTKVLEENTSSAPEVLLRNMINLGRSCPIMRDELLMQCVKQIRENPSDEAELRVWRLLRACLRYFPPSSVFENYIESFFLGFVKSKPDQRTVLVCSCIRHMHEAIAMYGYNKKIFEPWDSSLKSVKVWLQPSLPSTGSITSDSSSMMSGSSPAKPNKVISNQRGPLLYSQMDPAFISDSQGSHGSQLGAFGDTTPSPVASSAVSDLRGTRENWIKRFRQLSQEEEDVSLGEFNEMLFASSLVMDEQDKAVLMFLVTGELPPRSLARAITRELIADGKLFFPGDAKESEKRRKRRKILHHMRGPIDVDVESMDGKLDAVKQFWEDVVCPCVGCDILSLGKPVSPVRSAVSTVTVSGALARTLSSDEPVTTSSSHHQRKEEEELPVVPPEEAFLSWEIYRDIVQVGAVVMIRNHEQQIRNTSRQASRVITSTTKKPAFVFQTPASKGKTRRAASTKTM